MGVQQVLGIDGIVIGDRIGDGVVGIDLQRRIERGDMLVERDRPPHVVDRTLDQIGDLFEPDFPSVRGFEMAEGAQDEVDFLDHMHRQTDGARLVHDRAFDALPDPPGRVGREAETALGVELLDRVDQAEVALFDQIEQWNAAIEVMLGDVHHEAQVVLDHPLPRLELARARAARPGILLLRGEQRFGTDLVQVMLGDVIEQIVLRRAGRSLFTLFAGLA